MVLFCGSFISHSWKCILSVSRFKFSICLTGPNLYNWVKVVKTKAFYCFLNSDQHPHPQPSLVTSLLLSLKLSVTFSVNMGPPCLRMSSMAIWLNASSTLLESLAEVSMALTKSSWWAMVCASSNGTSRKSVKSDLLPGMQKVFNSA